MKKQIWLIPALLLLAAAIAAGIFLSRYVLVDFQIYPRNAAELDLRGKALTVSHYEKLSEVLPDTRIRWDIPFQESTLDSATQTLTVPSLTEEEAGLLACFCPDLKTVDGTACSAYDGLLALARQRPDIRVVYRVTIGGSQYAANATRINLPDIREEDVENLAFLPNLQTVTISGGQPDGLDALQAYCREVGIDLRPRLRGRLISEDTTELTLAHATDGEAALLRLLPALKRVHLTEPVANADLLLQLREDLPSAEVTWEKTLLGLTFREDARQIDLTAAVSLGPDQQPGDQTPYQQSLAYAIQGDAEEVPTAVKLWDHIPLPDKTGDTLRIIEEAEAAMAYFPEAETLILCGSFLDNEAMSAFRERQAEAYKVVWTVRCGKVATRTDAVFFMPVKYHVYYLQDSGAYNLRYCPELVAVDIGHMSVSDISFVEYMPNLTYLILAHTAVRDIEPLRSCKNLKFLELDHTGVLDFSPLQDCPALEDLNIGMTWNDVEPLKQVTWLKNLWMISRSNSAPELIEALPDTNVVYAGTATVDSGWRDLPNYFAMRDMLKMFYMTW